MITFAKIYQCAIDMSVLTIFDSFIYVETVIIKRSICCYAESAAVTEMPSAPQVLQLLLLCLVLYSIVDYLVRCSIFSSKRPIYNRECV